MLVGGFNGFMCFGVMLFGNLCVFVVGVFVVIFVGFGENVGYVFFGVFYLFGVIFLCLLFCGFLRFGFDF